MLFSVAKKGGGGIEEEPAERWLICLKELQEEMTAKITVSEQKRHKKNKVELGRISKDASVR